MQRARNGRGGEDEHVGLHAQALDALLVPDPETVFFIHHQQAQVLEADVLLQQAVGADDDIHCSILQPLQRAGLLLAAVQAAQHGDPRAERLEAALEGLGVLLRQHRGGHQHGHLLAVEQRLESGAQGDLGLAVADVAAHQPFHGPRAFHVAQHVLDGLHLVVGLDVLEGVFKLLVQRRGRRKAVADVLPARGVQADQVAGHVEQGGFDARLGARPGGTAEAVERRRDALTAAVAVFLHQAEAVRRHVELGVIGVGEFHELAALVVDVQERHAAEAPDAVIGVYHQVAGVQRADVAQRVRRTGGRRRGLLLVAEQIAGAQDHEAFVRPQEAVAQASQGQQGAARWDGSLAQAFRGAVGDAATQIVRRQHVAQPPRFGGGTAQDEHAEAVAVPLFQVGDKAPQIAGKRRRAAHAQFGEGRGERGVDSG